MDKTMDAEEEVNRLQQALRDIWYDYHANHRKTWGASAHECKKPQCVAAYAVLQKYLGRRGEMPETINVDWRDKRIKDQEERITKLARDLFVLRTAVEEMDKKMQVESSFTDKDGQDYVAFYLVPCGPWHKILGLVRS